MNKFVIDAYAWIEYFDGTTLGYKVKEILTKEGNIIITNTITITEVISKFKRKNKDFDSVYKAILSLSNIIYSMDAELSKEAGLLHAETKLKNKHFSVADIFVLLTARKLNAKVVTGDEDFRGFKEAVMIK